MHWIGSHNAQLTIRVLDGATGRPVGNASVQLFDPEGGPRSSAGETDVGGVVHLNHEFTAAGTTSPVRKTGCVFLRRATLKVQAEGYAGVWERLEKFTGPAWDLYGPVLPAVHVWLKKK
jgi:hypothetical protein